MKKNQQGLTLIEMMIAMVIGLLVVGVVITMFVTNVRSNRDNVSMIRLNQELRGAMTFISNELKRSGYSADPTNNAFIDELAIVGGNCLRYAYDEDEDGTLDTGGDPEHFGFRLNANALEWSRDNSSGACGGSWDDITDINIASITAFTITPSPIVAIPAGSVGIYTITVTLTGTTQLSGGTVASRTISEEIRIRNDDA